MSENKELLEFLGGNEYDFFFGWIDKITRGQIFFDHNMIVVNIYLALAEIIVHEFIHWKYNTTNEKFVEEKTAKKLDRMTIKEIKEVVDKFTSVSITS